MFNLQATGVEHIAVLENLEKPVPGGDEIKETTIAHPLAFSIADALVS